jgi:sortilin (neurotensin receptor 3)
VVYALAPSRKDVNTLWAGTDDGLIHVTHDGGKTWKNVTPPDLTPWSKVSQLDASHFDNETVYASINRFRLDDLRPYIFRTHDTGKTWKKITDGIPENEVVNTVREDPVRKGMLFAGTERAAYVSFDDGGHWQSLRLNMPATSIRDLVIHDDDVIVGTHGRSFWILDDITPLRQLGPQTTLLYKPQTAIRIARNRATDTPLPPEVPAGQNPPDGAILDYYLASKPSAAVTLEVFDHLGKSVRKFSSDDKPEPIEEREMNVPTYWVRTPKVLSARPGMHRWVWDLHLSPPGAVEHDYPISAIFHDTPRYPIGPWVLPGGYSVKLIVDGKTYTQPLTVKMDPRSKTPVTGLTEQFTLGLSAWSAMNQDFDALEKIRRLREVLREKQNQTVGALTEAVTALDEKVAAIAGAGGGGRRGRGNRAASENLSRLNGELAQVLQILEESDQTPTTQAAASLIALRKSLDGLLAQWSAINAQDIPAINGELKKVNLPLVSVSQ